MGVNKVDLSTGENLFDISQDTVTPETLAEGVTAHDASGEPIVGTMVVGGDGTLVQQQVDYEENDTSKVTYIKNRPFYTSDGFSYEWDGTAPDETKKVSGDNPQHFYYKISDNIMSVSDLVGAKAAIANTIITIREKSIKTYENGSFCYNWYGSYEMVFVCVETGFYDTWMGTVELTPGLWFSQAGVEFTLLTKEAGVKQIDNKYIPKANAIDEDNADLPVTAGLVKTELEKKADLVDGKIPVEQIPDGIGSEGEKEVEIITGNLDLSTLTMSNLSHTYQQILEAIDGNKNIILRGETMLGSAFATPSYVDTRISQVGFNLLTYINIGAGLTLYYFRITVNPDNNVVVTPLTVSTVS